MKFGYKGSIQGLTNLASVMFMETCLSPKQVLDTVLVRISPCPEELLSILLTSLIWSIN